MDSRGEEAKKPRTIIWVAEHGFQGWTCSQCEWNYPLPTLLNDAEAKSAYDRLALGKFREHACEGHAPRLGAVDSQSFTARIRKLVKQGFKPRVRTRPGCNMNCCRRLNWSTAASLKFWNRLARKGRIFCGGCVRV